MKKRLAFGFIPCEIRQITAMNPILSSDLPTNKPAASLGGEAVGLAGQPFPCDRCAFSESHSFRLDLSNPRASRAYLVMCRDLAAILTRRHGGARPELAMGVAPSCVAHPVGNTGSTSKSATAAQLLNGPSEVLGSGSQNV